MARVVSVNISKKKGTAKIPVDLIVIDTTGVREDAHAGRRNLLPGDAVIHKPYTLTFSVITLSDRVSSGMTKDTSAPLIIDLLKQHFSGTPWRISITYSVIPDEKDRLREKLTGPETKNTDFIFTTGGTGAKPRDITPDVVTETADKIIPGIMEAVRLKYGTDKPNAPLSRSVAAVRGRHHSSILSPAVKRQLRSIWRKSSERPGT